MLEIEGKSKIRFEMVFLSFLVKGESSPRSDFGNPYLTQLTKMANKEIKESLIRVKIERKTLVKRSKISISVKLLLNSG